MRGLVFAQSINKPGRHDANGAFLPGSRHFTVIHGLPKTVLLDDKHDREKMLDAIAEARDLDVIAYFGHGTRSSLPSADIHWRDLTTLAPLVKQAAGADCQIVLYACSAGEVGCFANQLSKLMDYRYTVWGHTCVGHSYTNPYVTYFPNLRSPYLIDPQGPLWTKWRKLIKGKSDVWARFPFMSQADLEVEVQNS